MPTAHSKIQHPGTSTACRRALTSFHSSRNRSRSLTPNSIGFWSVLGLILLAPAVSVGQAADGDPITPELARELAEFGATLRGHLKYWHQVTRAADAPFPEPSGQSMLTDSARTCIADKYDAKWAFRDPDNPQDATRDRVAAVAGELAKIAASYQMAIETRPEEIIGAPCGAASGDQDGLRWLRSSQISVNCPLIDTAEYWYQSVRIGQSARVDDSGAGLERDDTRRADAARRFLSFKRSLLPYSHWIDQEKLVSALQSIDLAACAENVAMRNGQEIELPADSYCIEALEIDKDTKRSACRARFLYTEELRVEHLKRVFAQHLWDAQQNAAIQSQGERAEVLQLAGSLARLSVTARNELGLDPRSYADFERATQNVYAKSSGGGSYDELIKALQQKYAAAGDLDGELICARVFAAEPGDESVPDRTACREWAESEQERLSDEIAFLNEVLSAQTDQYEAAIKLLKPYETATPQLLDADDLNWLTRAAGALYLRTRGAQAADRLYQRLGGPTDCGGAQSPSDQRCILKWSEDQSSSHPKGDLAIDIQVVPAAEFDGELGASTQKPVQLFSLRDSHNCPEKDCFLAQSYTPAKVLLVTADAQTASDSGPIVPFVSYDWDITVLEVQARQVAGIRCTLDDIVRRAEKETPAVCETLRDPVTMQGIECWRWGSPNPAAIKHWLGYLGANSLAVPRGLKITWVPAENALHLTGVLQADGLDVEILEPFTLSLTGQSQAEWQRVIGTAARNVVLKAAPAMSQLYATPGVKPGWFKLPANHEFVGLTIDRLSPITLRLYAYPTGHPELISAFRGSLDQLSGVTWDAPRTLLPAAIALAARRVDFGAINQLGELLRSVDEEQPLADLMARRDIFERALRNLTTDGTAQIDVTSTLGAYRDYQTAMEHPFDDLRQAWGTAATELSDEHQRLRDDINTKMGEAMGALMVGLPWPTGEAGAHLQELMGLATPDDAVNHIKGLVAKEAAGLLEEFIGRGGLLNCLAELERETPLWVNCEPPADALTRLGTEASRRFILFHQEATKTEKEANRLRKKWENLPASVTQEQLMRMAHDLRQQVARQAEDSTRTAWQRFIGTLAQDGGVLQQAAKALGEDARFVEGLTEAGARCDGDSATCRQLATRYALGAMFGANDELQDVERLIRSMVPQPELVFTAQARQLSDAMSDAERALAATVEEARDALQDLEAEIKRRADEAVDAAVDAVWLTAREAINFVPDVRETSGALYLNFSASAWGAQAGDRILGIDCRPEGDNWVCANQDLSTVAELNDAFRGLAPSSSALIRVVRDGEEMTLEIPRSISYSMDIVPKVPGLDIAQAASLSLSVDPTDGIQIDTTMDEAQLKNAVLTTAVEIMNDKAGFSREEIRNAYEEKLDAFKAACKEHLNIGWLGNDEICTDPIGLYRQALAVDPRQMATDLAQGIMAGNIALTEHQIEALACIEGDSIPDELEGAAGAACSILKSELRAIVALPLQTEAQAQAALDRVTRLPEEVLSAFGDALVDEAGKAVLGEALQMVNAAELAELQQTVFEYEARANELCLTAQKRVADIFGDALPPATDCKSVAALLKPKVLEAAAKKRAEEFLKDEVNKVLEEHAGELIETANKAFDEQKKLVEQAVEEQTREVMAELRKGQAAMCRALAKLAGPDGMRGLIDGVTVTLDRPNQLRHPADEDPWRVDA